MPIDVQPIRDLEDLATHRSLHNTSLIDLSFSSKVNQIRMDFLSAEKSLATSPGTGQLMNDINKLWYRVWLQMTRLSSFDILNTTPYSVLLDKQVLQAVVEQKLVTTEQKREQYLNQLYSAFDTDPIEDGVTHIAELIIGDLLRYDDIYVLEWLKGICLDTSHPGFASSVIRCLGRQTAPGTPSWRAELVRDGLGVHNLEIRDSIIQAAELWDDPSVLDVLRDHNEPVPWLRNYVQDVLEDLAV